MSATPVLTAALAGVPIGIQRQGIWEGRRQIFVRFAGPAETATMYTVDALARELSRGLERSVFHSVCVAGRDTLGNADYITAALSQLSSRIPVMLDTDGQRPDAIAAVHAHLSLVQVTLEPPVPAVALERAMQTLAAAVKLKCAHGVVVAGRDETSDAEYLQIVEEVHKVSPEAPVVLHPGQGTERGPMDRRWSVLLEHAMARHRDVRVHVRLIGQATLG